MGSELHRSVERDPSEALRLARNSKAAGEGIWLSLAEELRADPTSSGPLSMAPFGVKDNLFVRGLPATGGTPAFAHVVARTDSPVVAILRAAGAVPIGKTQMHELGFGVTSLNRHGGAVINPRWPTRSAGGSSGGSAAAVAAGHVPFSLGTDTGGSCRLPAVFCGVWGFRPSHGRWPAGQSIPISPTRDTVGVIAKDLQTIGTVDAVVTGASAVLPAPDDTVRLGVPIDFFFDPIDPGVKSMFDAAVAQLSRAGIEVVPVALPELAALDHVTGFPIALFEAGVHLRAFCLAHDVSFDDLEGQIANDDVRQIFSMMRGNAVTGHAYFDAIEYGVPAIRTVFDRAFDDYRISALLMPACPVPAPSRDDSATTVCVDGIELPLFPTVSRNTSPASLSSHPSIAIPLLPRDDGMVPGCGLLLEGRRHEDRALLALAGRIGRLLHRLDRD